MYCPNCKKEVEDDSLFCPECGTKTVQGADWKEPDQGTVQKEQAQGAVQNKQEFCENCGAALEEGSLFCPECGARMGVVNQEESPAPRRVERPRMRSGSGTGRKQARPAQRHVARPEFVSERGGKGRKKAHSNYGRRRGSGQNWKIAAGISAAVLVVCIGLFVFYQLRENNTGDDPVNSTAAPAAETTVAPTAGASVTSAAEATATPAAEASVTPAAETTVTPTIAPTATPAATPTPEITATPTPAPTPKTLVGAKTRDAQQGVLATGGQLDLTHMGNLMYNTGSTYGTYVLDITNLQEYDAGNADQPMPASALIGVPILFTCADAVDKGEISMDTPVTLNYTFENGRGVFKSSDNGSTFPLSQMLSEALMNSDNNALNSLMDFLTLDKINSTCQSYGYTSVDMQRKLMSESSDLENYISPKDAAMMLNAVYQDDFSGIGKSFMESYFKISSNDTSNMGMYPAASSCEKFLNLNGITDSRYNEIAVIKKGDVEIIVSIFTCNGVGTTSASGMTTLTDYVLNTLKILG